MGRIRQAVEDWKEAIHLDWQMAFHVYYAHKRYVPDDVELGRIITTVALDHVGDLDRVSGYAVGAMAETGEFYTASLILSAHLNDEGFLRMVSNESPWSVLWLSSVWQGEIWHVIKRRSIRSTMTQQKSCTCRGVLGQSDLSGLARQEDHRRPQYTPVLGPGRDQMALAAEVTGVTRGANCLLPHFRTLDIRILLYRLYAVQWARI